MSGLHECLAAFARHLRDPEHAPRPVGLSPRGLAVYGEIVFNNLSSFSDACFPITRRLLGDMRWRRLQRRFIRDWPSQTPWFREIPREFLAFLLTSPDTGRLPRWIGELAHYEWAELAVDLMETAVPEFCPEGDLLREKVVVNPALLNLSYRWPVHRIGPDYRPRKPRPTWLAVYRDRQDEVRFTLLSPASSRLLDLLSREPMTGDSAICQLSNELGRADARGLLAYGGEELRHFQRIGLILGVAR